MKHQHAELSCLSCATRQKSVFCRAEQESLEHIDSQKNCVTFKKGNMIFHEGGFPMGLYCINAGKVKLAQLGSEGKEQIVRFAKEGDVLGYRSLLAGDRYSATAVALEDTRVCFIPRDSFLGVVATDNKLSLEVMKQLAQDLKNAQEKITILAQKPVRERMAETLLFIKETFGYEEDGMTLSVALSREEIANLTGTATETAIRLLSDFKHEHILELSGKKIKVLNLNELVKIANLYD